MWVRIIVLMVSFLIAIQQPQANRYSPAKLPQLNQLKHNRDIAHEISTIIAKSHENKREALYRGVLWLIKFTDSLDVFLSVSQEYLTVLGELHHTNDLVQKRIMRALLKNAIARVSPYLSELYDDDLEDYMNYLFIVPTILEIYPQATWPGEFAQNHFLPHSLKEYKKEFKKAYESQDYDELSNFMVDSAMMDLVTILDKHHTFNITHNPYSKFHLMMQSLPWDRTIEDDDYADQNYCMTHLILGLNRYGRTPITIPSNWRDKIIDYHWKHFDTIRHKMDDLDLFAEFLYDLKVLDQSEDYRYHEGINHILKQQHSDGSWGVDEDLESEDLYDVIHPTWTALSVLNIDLGTQ